MLIGREFDEKSRHLLLGLQKWSSKHSEPLIRVDEVIGPLNLDRQVAREILEYLAEKKMITLETMGGPYLYGHVRLTVKGENSKTKVVR